MFMKYGRCLPTTYPGNVTVPRRPLSAIVRRHSRAPVRLVMRTHETQRASPSPFNFAHHRAAGSVRVLVRRGCLRECGAQWWSSPSDAGAPRPASMLGSRRPATTACMTRPCMHDPTTAWQPPRARVGAWCSRERRAVPCAPHSCAALDHFFFFFFGRLSAAITFLM